MGATQGKSTPMSTTEAQGPQGQGVEGVRQPAAAPEQRAPEHGAVALGEGPLPGTAGGPQPRQAPEAPPGGPPTGGRMSYKFQRLR